MSIDYKIRELIRQNAYITCDRLMEEALSLNPTSYYKHVKSLAEEGDFITAPEVSQLFGEIIGLWCIKEWQRIGCPNNCSLVELGAGRGLLMRDLLRTAKLVPQFYNALSVHIIDINENFIAQQKSNLQKFNLPINWHSSIEDIPKKPTIFIANEFFDAMPIKQYIKVKESWYERIFVVQPVDEKIKYDKIAVSKQLQEYLLKTHTEAKDGAVLEKSYKSIEIMKFISEHIEKLGGSGLIIDYGYDINPNTRTRYQYNSTLQAIKNHTYCSIIENIGIADLSSHVDFHALKTVAINSKIKAIDTISQRDFLIENGILLRKQTLQDKLDQPQAQLIEKQVDRLISLKEMGSLFKVLQVMS
ncbi:MAG: class I SAM-dependent methyltransferase [Rickettsia endosymbiont of Pentastiridius leporinus]